MECETIGQPQAKTKQNPRLQNLATQNLTKMDNRANYKKLSNCHKKIQEKDLCDLGFGNVFKYDIKSLLHKRIIINQTDKRIKRQVADQKIFINHILNKILMFKIYKTPKT